MAEYIDREDILRRWNNALLEMVPEKDGRHAVSFETVIRFIEMYPAVDVAEVAHGVWEKADDGDGAVCSVCREDFCNIYLEIDRFRYCPNCGARMDGDGDA